MIEWNNEHMLLTSFYDITQFMQRHQDPPDFDKSYRALSGMSQSGSP
jgi:hypothetical protein